MPGWNQRKMKDVIEEMRRVEEVMRRERRSEEVRRVEEPRRRRQSVEMVGERNQDMFSPTPQQPRRKKRVEAVKEEGSQDMFAPTQERLSPATTPVEVAQGRQEVEDMEEKEQVDLDARRDLPDSEEIDDLTNLDISVSVFLRDNNRSRFGADEDDDEEERRW